MRVYKVRFRIEDGRSMDQSPISNYTKYDPSVFVRSIQLARLEDEKQGEILIAQLLMQAVIYKREKSTSEAASSRDQSTTEGKIITRKRTGRNLNGLKRIEQQQPLQRQKRYHSSQALRFMRNTNSNQQGFYHQREEYQPSPNPKTGWDTTANQQPIPTPIKIQKKNSLVFNRFSQQQREEIRQILTLLSDQIHQYSQQADIQGMLISIENYLTRIEENNVKLLEINYFFQREFNQRMGEKNQAKRKEKCNKNYCLECRYHLQKENNWLLQKNYLLKQIQFLQSEIQRLKPKRSEQSQDNCSIKCEFWQNQSINLQVERLKQQLKQKDEEYMILLKQFNYLDGINKDIKNKLAKTIEQYKYLSIENRTLLGIKNKLIEKELECTRFKDQRDRFKKKAIETFKKYEIEIQNMENERCQCRNDQNPQSQGSFFSLSELSNNQGTIRNDNSILSILHP